MGSSSDTGTANNQPPSSNETFGPPAPAQPEPVYGPDLIQTRPIVLVFGPGLARTFAYAGVLRALNDAKIPIAAIAATEMGSLIAALYAKSANLNHFEWGLLKFKDSSFPGQSQGLFSKLIPARASELEDSIRKALGDTDISQTKIPLRIAVQREDGSVAVLEKGPLAQAVRASMAVEGFLPAAEVDRVLSKSAHATRPFVVKESRALGPVVVIDVANERERSSGASDLSEADLVIRPDMRGIAENDFKKRSDAAFRGKTATQAKLREIKHLVGLPEDPQP